MPPASKHDKPATKTTDYRLELQIGYVLRRVHQRASAIFKAHFAPHKLTPTQFAAIAKIADEGEVSQNYLGRLTAMDPATMKGVIDRLFGRGLIVSKPDPTDRRRTLWRLTESGTQLLCQSLPAGSETSEETLAPLDEAEQKTLLALLSRMV